MIQRPAREGLYWIKIHWGSTVMGCLDKLVFDQNSRCWTNDTTKPNELIRGNPPFYILLESRGGSWKLKAGPKLVCDGHLRWGGSTLFCVDSILSGCWPFVGAVAGLDISCLLDTCFLYPGVGLLLWSRSVPPGCLLGMMGSIQISWMLVGIWSYLSILKNRFGSRFHGYLLDCPERVLLSSIIFQILSFYTF